MTDSGCPDTDGDGYSDPTPGWTAANGADLWPNDVTQWADTDGDTYGDNSSGPMVMIVLQSLCTSTNDRLGCPDTDGDGWSDADDHGPHPMVQTLFPTIQPAGLMLTVME